MDSAKQVTVTYFINPHLFWYRCIDDSAGQYGEILALEEKINQYYKNINLKTYSAQISDFVAVFFWSWQKFIRAKVITTETHGYSRLEYVLWAVDYGFPFKSVKGNIREIPPGKRLEFTQPFGNIQRGGIFGIFPAKKEIRLDDMSIVLEQTEEWQERGCKMIEDLLRDCTHISFQLIFKDDRSHNWGDMLIEDHKGKVHSVSELLIKGEDAIKSPTPDRFRVACLELKTVSWSNWKMIRGVDKFCENTINPQMYCDAVLNRAVNRGDDVDMKEAQLKVIDWYTRNELKLRERAGSMASGVSSNSVDCVEFSESASIDQFNMKSLISMGDEQHRPDPLNIGIINHSGELLLENRKRRRSHDSGSECEETILTVSPPQSQGTFEDFKEIYNAWYDMISDNADEPNDDVTTCSGPLHCLIADTGSAVSSSFRSIPNLDDLIGQLKITNDKLSKGLEQIEAVKVFPCNSNNSTNPFKESEFPPLSKEVNCTSVSFPSYPDSTISTQTNSVAYNESEIKAGSVAKPRRLEKKGKNSSKRSTNTKAMLPAGFDIAMTKKYNDEGNHWHTKKTTRYDSIPHDRETLMNVNPADIFDPDSVK